jgi:hypothetical protein
MCANRIEVLRCRPEVVLVVVERGRVLKLHVQEIDETWRLDPGRATKVEGGRQQHPDLACWLNDQSASDIVRVYISC